MHSLLSILQRPLVRQIGGAMGGAAVALIIYGAYTWGAPKVASLLQASAAEGRQDRVELVVERARSAL